MSSFAGSVQTSGGITMSKRKYTHIKAMEQQIISMRKAGMTRQEIADELGLTREQIKGWVKRYNHRSRVFLQEREYKMKGRPRKDGQPPEQDMRKELERLRMENKLLRDFLQPTERK